MDFDWKNIVTSIAPVIGTALGGPLAGTATKLLAGAILGDENADGTAVQAAVSSGLTTDQIAAIKRADQEFAVKMREMDIRLEELAGADRASARNRETAVRDKVPAILAIITMVAFFGYIGAVTFWDVGAAKDKEFINLALGWLGGVASTVIAYYFGSSSGSEQKNRAIAQALTAR